MDDIAASMDEQMWLVETKSMGGEPGFRPLVRPRHQLETLKTSKINNPIIFVLLSFLTSPLVLDELPFYSIQQAIGYDD